MALKTNLHRNYAVDSKKEEEGVWKEFDGGIKLKLRRLSSKASQDARREAEKPYTSQLRDKEPDPDILEKVFIQQLAHGVIVDWEGIEDDDGKPVEFTPALAVELLSDEALKDFRGEVIGFAISRDTFRAASNEDAVGNSKTT
ncbi:MAG: hypothetical protein RIA09_15705 [Hoeflea sp.]|jgi:hypothetical protein|uniref:hypothetical protein n=1 Tax=Hoeflea sp. TaxID=1940281 RepID=UPI0032ED7F84